MTPPTTRAAQVEVEKMKILARYEAQGLYDMSLLKQASEGYDALQESGDASWWLLTWEGKRVQWTQERPAGYATVTFSTIQHLLWRNAHCVDDRDRPALIRKEYILMQSPPILNLKLWQAAAKFHRDSREWFDDRYHVDLREILRGPAIPRIRNIVGFGLGGFFSQQHEADNKRSMMQHQLVFSLRDILQSRQETTGIRVLVQDPGYGNLEKRVLERLPMLMRAVDHPFQGFLEVDEQTAVVSIAPQIPVKQIITDISRPALIVWDATSPMFNDRTGPENEEWRNRGNSTYVSTISSFPGPSEEESDTDISFALLGVITVLRELRESSRMSMIPTNCKATGALF